MDILRLRCSVCKVPFSSGGAFLENVCGHRTHPLCAKISATLQCNFPICLDCSPTKPVGAERPLDHISRRMECRDLGWRFAYGPPWDDGGVLWGIQDDMVVVRKELKKAGIFVFISKMVTMVVRGALGFDAVFGIVCDRRALFPRLPELDERTIAALKQEVLSLPIVAAAAQALPRASLPPPAPTHSSLSFTGAPVSSQPSSSVPQGIQPSSSVPQGTSSSATPQDVEAARRWLINFCNERHKHGPAEFRLDGPQDVSTTCENASCGSFAVKLAPAKCGICGQVLCSWCWGFGDNERTLKFLNPSAGRRKAGRVGLGRGAGEGGGSAVQ